MYSGVATGVARGQSTTPDSKIFAKNREKEEKITKNREKRKNQEEKAKIGKFLSLLPLLTDKAGFATGYVP